MLRKYDLLKKTGTGEVSYLLERVVSWSTKQRSIVDYGIEGRGTPGESIIHNIEKVEANQMSIKWWKGKQNVTYLYMEFYWP